MPQPLKKWDDRIRFSPDSLAQRPNLAVKIAQVVAASTNLEVHIGRLLAEIMQSKADVGVTMYLALSGSAAKQAVLQAVADQYVLDKTSRNKFSALIKSIRHRAKERNAVIHGMWSLHPGDNQALINCPPQSMISEVARLTSTISHLESHPGTSATYSSRLAGIMVYKERDFDNVLARIKTVREDIDDLKGTITGFRHEFQQKLLQIEKAADRFLSAIRQEVPPDAPPNSTATDE